MNHRKIHKFSDTKNIAVNTLKLKNWPYSREISPKMQMEDPDQTEQSERSSLIRVCTECSDLSLRKFRIITVATKKEEKHYNTAKSQQLKT